MAKARPILGRIQCLGCKREAAAKEQGGTGLACYSCQWCGLFVQAHAAEADSMLRKRITPLEAGEALPGARPPAELEHHQERREDHLTADDGEGDVPTIFDLLKPKARPA